MDDYELDRLIFLTKFIHEGYCESLKKYEMFNFLMIIVGIIVIPIFLFFPNEQILAWFLLLSFPWWFYINAEHTTHHQDVNRLKKLVYNGGYRLGFYETHGGNKIKKTLAIFDNDLNLLSHKLGSKEAEETDFLCFSNNTNLELKIFPSHHREEY